MLYTVCMTNLTYTPMRTYSSSHRMAKEYAKLLEAETGKPVTMIEAVDLALFQSIKMCEHFDYEDRYEQDHPGFDHAPEN